MAVLCDRVVVLEPHNIHPCNLERLVKWKHRSRASGVVLQVAACMGTRIHMGSDLSYGKRLLVQSYQIHFFHHDYHAGHDPIFHLSVGDGLRI